MFLFERFSGVQVHFEGQHVFFSAHEKNECEKLKSVDNWSNSNL